MSLFPKKVECSFKNIHLKSTVNMYFLCKYSVYVFTCFILVSSLRVCSSFRKSFLLPTRMMGTFGQKCFTSGVHFSGIFSTQRAQIKGQYWSFNTHQRSVSLEKGKDSVITTCACEKGAQNNKPKGVCLPKLSGLSIEKHIRMTSVSGYERGRSLS